ncbi:hypothetical protein L1276_000892 [Flavobacterium sp. HSC-32F16]|uniref:hypothetical protein n=1 Tax=Flavobacterium sp. HSC-32F16 TaxID=2910964 RepID=UPI0020A4D937|nr:hypothetical protein [Flavobacterium sp. HSC-32F16]MCP2025752.1 hypothetical protein [Flavobacterium sp. HSC-32F16]
MTPLEKILEWFDAQDLKIKSDFVPICSHFHTNENIQLEFDREKQIEFFREYIKEENLKPIEVVRRTLFLKSLFNFTMDSRDSEEGWEEARKINKKINDELESEGKGFGTYDTFMLDYEERKSKWIDWSNKWKLLLNSNLSDKAVGDWYFLSIRK